MSPESPDPCDYGFEPEFREQHWMSIYSEDSDRGRAYYTAVSAYLSLEDESRPGIASHKLSTNDYWLVTARECSSALEQWRQAGSPVPDEDGQPDTGWRQWIDFLELAAANHGFHVA